MDSMGKREHNFRGQRMEMASVYIPVNHLEQVDEIVNESEEANRSTIIRKAVKEYLDRENEKRNPSQD